MNLTRHDIMNECPDGSEEFTKEVIDLFENEINEIRDLLKIERLEDLENIAGAADKAYSLSQDLY